MAYQTNRFKAGSGCFKCRMCKRNTRDTGDNGSVELCPQCYELAGYENTVLDGEALTAGDEANIKAAFAQLRDFPDASAKAIAGWRETFSILEAA